MNDPDPEIAVVLTAYAAFARGDIDQAIAGLHPHVEWIEPDQFPYGGRRVGPAAVADYLRDSRSLWSELVSEPAATRRGNDIIVVHHVHGRLADGTFRDVTVADVFTFRNGLIVRMQAYGDPAQALARYSWTPVTERPAYLVLARVLLAQDRPGPALMLQRLFDAAASQGRTGTTIEIQALAAPQPSHRHAAGPTAS